MPFLLMMRIPFAEMRILTQRFSPATQKRWVCKFGKKRRLVRLLAWDTLFPETGRFPVIRQTLDMAEPVLDGVNSRAV